MTPIPGRAHLPQELVDMIIDHLYNDRKSLKACSLVCKAWTRCVRHLLFSIFYIHPSHVDKLSNMGSVTPFVRHLCIRGLRSRTIEFWSQVARRRPTFPNVQALSLIGVPWDSSVLGAALMGKFEAIVEFELQNFMASNFAHLVSIICMFPCLRKLRLGRDVRVMSSEEVLRETPPPPPSLRVFDLKMDSSTYRALLDWLASGQESLALCAFHLYCIGSTQDNFYRLNSFMRSVGPHLETFWWTYSPLSSNDIYLLPDLVWNTNLRCLQMPIYSGATNHARNMANVVEMLSRITSTHVEEITFDLFAFVWDRQPEAMINQWLEMDEVFARPQFSMLRRVNFCYVSDDLSVATDFATRLPRCLARGILYFTGPPSASLLRL